VEILVLAIFLVLRSGEYYPITSLKGGRVQFAQAILKQVQGTVRWRTVCFAKIIQKFKFGRAGVV
jgi:hypothetical protein